jgi:glycerophosphoryl diester phosphodiesterase
MRQIAMCAHRGASEGCRPGTLESFRRAAEGPSDYVEFDVRRLADGALAAFHDPACNGRGLSGLTLDDLRREAGYAVPRVEDVMTALRGLTRAHIDLKEPGYEPRVLALADAVLGPGSYVVTTLEDGMIVTIKRDFPGVRVGLSLGRDLTGEPLWTRARVRMSELFPRRRLLDCGADFVSVHHRLARLNVLRVAERMGIPVFVWTVNDREGLARFARSRAVECIVTDEPEKAAQWLGLTSPSPPAP